MTRLKMTGIHKVTKTLASGATRTYHYAWRKGPQFWHSDNGVKVGSPEYRAALMAVTPRGEKADGKFREIILRFLDSGDFAKMAPRYQSDIRNSLYHAKNGIDAEFGEAPIAAFMDTRIRGKVLEWRDKIGGKVGDDRVRHLQRVVGWAYDRGYLTHHRLQRIKSLYKSSRAEILWTEAEIDLFVAKAPPHIGRILIAATETGLRPADLARLSRFQLQDGRFLVKTRKRGRMASIPVSPKMAALIAETPKEQTVFICNKRRQPYRHENYLGDAVTTWRDKIGLRKELRLYDARGTAATRLLEAGVTIAEIATHMGWSVKYATEIIELYVALHPNMTNRIAEKLAAAKRHNL